MRRVIRMVTVNLMGLATLAAAATYHVDFEGGNDEADGLSPATAFRRAPGDPVAKGRAAALALQPGDTVLFKGGVVYRGRLVIRWAGRAGAPIVFDGNSAGAYGTGPAILDGSEEITGWRPCASADECGGNPNFARILVTTIPAERGLTAPALGLTQGERMLYPSQYPAPQDPFYRDKVETDYLRPDGRMTRTSITDARLAELGGAALVGATIGVFVEQNDLRWRRITGFDPRTDTITFEGLDRNPAGRYAIVNSAVAPVFQGPGEYVLDDQPDAHGRLRLWAWPHDDQPISRVVQPLAMDLGDRGSHHVTIRGFTIRNYRLALRARNVEGVTVRDNRITRMREGGYAHAVQFGRVTDLVFENNQLDHLPQMRGVVAHTGTRVAFRGNRVDRVGRSPLVFFFVDPGQIVGNTVTNCTGMHSNAITVYESSKNILVANNRVRDSLRPMTVQSSENIFVIQNDFEADSTVIGIWPGRVNNLFFLNNLFRSRAQSVYVNQDRLGDGVWINNIWTGWEGFPLGGNHRLSHNLYLKAPTRLAEGEFVVEEESRVLTVDADGRVRPILNGPAVDMGAEVSSLWPRTLFPDFDFDRDIEGRPRLHGPRMDIGPWETPYPPGALDGRPPIATGPASLPSVPTVATEPISGAAPIIIPALRFKGQGGGEVRAMSPDTLATTDFIRYWEADGHWLEYRVEAPVAGDYTLSLRYAAEFEAPRGILLDGQPAPGLDRFTLPATGGWGIFKEFSAPAAVRLRAGENRLRLVSRGGRGCNLDRIRLQHRDADPLDITAGAFAAQGGGARPAEVVPSPQFGLFFAWNNDGHWLEWEFEAPAAGLYRIELRYATLSVSPRRLEVDGQPAAGLESFQLPQTRGWRWCEEAVLPVPVELTAGRHTLRLTSLGGGGLNLDVIRLTPVRRTAPSN